MIEWTTQTGKGNKRKLYIQVNVDTYKDMGGFLILLKYILSMDRFYEFQSSYDITFKI